jgi:uncharacterized membrane protein YphA (DoxX/SURF4 family)
VFQYTLGIIVLIESLITLFQSDRMAHGQIPHRVLAVLAAAEALAALLFLIPATLRLGAVSLMAIFFAALAFHGLHGQWNLSLLVYAAGVFLVMIQKSPPAKTDDDRTSAS